MRKTSKLISFAAAASLLLSGCGTETPAPAVSESETTTAAAETTTAEATAATTTASTTTTVTTKDEPEPEPVSISPAYHKDEFTATEYYGYSSRLTTDATTSESIMYGSQDGNGNTVTVLDYTLSDDTSQESNNDNVTFLTINADAAKIKVRPSVNAFSDTVENDIPKRLDISMYTPSESFGSAYEIKYDDPVVTVIPYKAAKDESFYTGRKYERSCPDITLGYTIDAPVTVNAFVCGSDEGLSILIDPEYMYGLPMFTLGDVFFDIGRVRVTSDSLFFTGVMTEGMPLNTADYAYAKVTMQDTHVVYSKKDGYANTCTVSDIEIIKTFSDISELDVTHDTDIISGKNKDPQMKEVYDAVMNAKNEIYTNETRGILLLDLDFDVKPEIIVTKSIINDDKNTGRLSSDIYRVEDGELKFIDTLYPILYTGEGNAAYLGLSELKDGTPAWFMSKQTEELYDSYDYLYTLDGDTLNEYPLFTAEEAGSDPVILNGEPAPLDYFYMGERIVPEIVMKEEPYSETGELNFETPVWNGVAGYFGMWELFGFARADYCESIKTSYPLLSDWISDLSSHIWNGTQSERYEITDREFAHKIAYMVDDFYNGRSNGVEHNYWFLGAYAKPVIYLYPEERTDVSVQVNFPLGGELTCTYPEYSDGWNVTAMPDGTLYDKNGDEYYCLYWEGKGAADFDMSKGFCVAGADTAKFLREKLIYIGLTAREANEFIIYWLPKMQDNPYNVIALHTDDYARSVPLTVSPAPDTQIRVFMTYYASDTPVDIPEQELPHYERNGFTLVEWGGSEE